MNRGVATDEVNVVLGWTEGSRCAYNGAVTSNGDLASGSIGTGWDWIKGKRLKLKVLKAGQSAEWALVLRGKFLVVGIIMDYLTPASCRKFS